MHAQGWGLQGDVHPGHNQPHRVQQQVQGPCIALHRTRPSESRQALEQVWQAWQYEKPGHAHAEAHVLHSTKQGEHTAEGQLRQP